MKFTDFSKFKNEFDKFISLAKKGENVIITKSGKPILSVAGISKDEVEDYILAEHYQLDKKARNIGSNKAIRHKEVKKYLGL